MNLDFAEQIEAWFAAQDGDGEFLRSERTIPYTVVGPPQDRARILYATKPGLIATAMHDFPAISEFGLVGRGGLPNRSDVAWLREFVGEQKICFFGDLDPIDLLVFAWLRAMLAPLQLLHFGVNDTLLEKLGISPAENITIPLSKSEQASLAILQDIFPDLRETVGSKCVQLLEAGRKMELEAIVCNRAVTEEFLRLVCSSGSE